MTTRYEAMRDALESARVGLRDWETPENRYKALRAIDAALAMSEDVKPEPIRFTNRQIYEAVLAAMKECAPDEPPMSFDECMIDGGQPVVFLHEFARAILAAAPDMKP